MITTAVGRAAGRIFDKAGASPLDSCGISPTSARSQYHVLLRALAAPPTPDGPAAIAKVVHVDGSAYRRLAGSCSPQSLHAPVGLDLGAESPEEIALSIVAEVLAALRGRAGGALDGYRGALHERGRSAPARASPAGGQVRA